MVVIDLCSNNPLFSLLYRHLQNVALHLCCLSFHKISVFYTSILVGYGDCDCLLALLTVLDSLIACFLHSFIHYGGGVVKWFRVLDLKSGGPLLKSITLLLSGFLLGIPEFNSPTVLCKQPTGQPPTTWGSQQFMFVQLFTVPSISTTVLNSDRLIHSFIYSIHSSIQCREYG